MMSSTQSVPFSATPMIFDLETRRAVQRAVHLGFALLERLSTIDLRAYEPLSAQVAVPLLLRGLTKDLLDTAEKSARLLKELSVLVGGDALVGEAQDVDNWDFDMDFDLGSAYEGRAEPHHDKFNEEIELALAVITRSDRGAIAPENMRNICAMLVAKLREASHRLAHARQTGSKWGILTEGEETRRKTQRALHVGLSLATRIALPEAAPQVEAWSAGELEQALHVRELLLDFRHAVLLLTHDLEHVSVHDLALSMRASRMRLFELFSDERYRLVRAPDRFELRALHQRISQWLAGLCDDAQHGREILADFRTFADLLYGINNREILVQYDKHAYDSAMEDLHDLLSTLDVTTRNAWHRFAEILWRTRPLSCRDGELLEYVDRELQSSADHPTALRQRCLQMIQRLAQLRF